MPRLPGFRIARLGVSAGVSRLVFVVVVLVLVVLLGGFVVFSGLPFSGEGVPADSARGEVEDGVLRAALLDGLFGSYPNVAFNASLYEGLEEAGFGVDGFYGEDVSVDRLRDVGGYDVVFLRVHSAVHADGFLYLFSGEPYTEGRYVSEQLLGGVREAYPFEENVSFFALKALFLGERGCGLNGSVVVLMGCNGTGDAYSLGRILDAGAVGVVAWDGFVDLGHSDEAVLALCDAVFSEGLGWREAVDEVNGLVLDPFGSRLVFFEK